MLDPQNLSGLFSSRPHSDVLWLLMLLIVPAVRAVYYFYNRQSPQDARPAPPLPLHSPLTAEAAVSALPAAAKPAPERIAALMRRYPGHWAIAGGWALDLHLKRPTREHGDIEIAVLRREQQLLREYLIGWRVEVVDSGARRPWRPGEQLELPLHELYADPPAADVGWLEVLLSEADGEDWVYRRDARVRLPLAQAVLSSADGIPYLTPQIVLLYKAKQPRERDEADLAATLPALNDAQRSWLANAVALAHPDSPWASLLGSGAGNSA